MIVPRIDIASSAAAHQSGSSGYVADDSWVNITLQRFFKVWRGVGGPYSPYHVGPNTMADVPLSGMPSAEFWRSAQVRAHQERGYRMAIAEYEVLAPTPAAHGVCSDNLNVSGSFLGWGGAEQYFIPEAYMDNLAPTGRIIHFH